MKLILAATAASAFLIPSQYVLESKVFNAEDRADKWLDGAKNRVQEWTSGIESLALDSFEKGQQTYEGFNVLSWAEGARGTLDGCLDEASAFANKVAESMMAAKDDAEAASGHHGRRRRHHKGFRNETIYELISKSKYFTKLYELINDDEELIDLFNTTDHNVTVFAPTDEAIRKAQENPHYEAPSKETIRKILSYHVAPGLYPAPRVLSVLTLPTLLKNDKFDGEGQRIRVNLGLRGVEINYYAKVVAVDVFAKNGVLHAIDHVLLPPPRINKILEILPSTFSTLVNGLYKTGLIDEFQNIEKGLTVFAPSNSAFERLGPRANAFLFSKHGEKYLSALLKYHVAPGKVLFTDTLVSTDSASTERHERIPKGHYHVDLETLLENHSLSVDIGRFGRLIDFVVNRYSRVAIKDGIARDGSIQVMANVILPPKKLGGFADFVDREMEPEELKERLELLL